MIALAGSPADTFLESRMAPRGRKNERGESGSDRGERRGVAFVPRRVDEVDAERRCRGPGREGGEVVGTGGQGAAEDWSARALEPSRRRERGGGGAQGGRRCAKGKRCGG